MILRLYIFSWLLLTHLSHQFLPKSHFHYSSLISSQLPMLIASYDVRYFLKPWSQFRLKLKTTNLLIHLHRNLATFRGSVIENIASQLAFMNLYFELFRVVEQCYYSVFIFLARLASFSIFTTSRLAWWPFHWLWYP